MPFPTSSSGASSWPRSKKRWSSRRGRQPHRIDADSDVLSLREWRVSKPYACPRRASRRPLFADRQCGGIGPTEFRLRYGPRGVLDAPRDRTASKAAQMAAAILQFQNRAPRTSVSSRVAARMSAQNSVGPIPDIRSLARTRSIIRISWPPQGVPSRVSCLRRRSR